MKALYRPKGVLVTAEQWFPGTKIKGVINLKNEVIKKDLWGLLGEDHVYFLTPGDWIVEQDGESVRYTEDEFKGKFTYMGGRDE